MNGSDVHHTLREMWDTRPARPREGRQVAGVAAAIARRYDIDPVLVRVGFVVAAFYGIGAALYIAGWALLPDEPGTAGPSGRRWPRMLLLVLLAIAAVAGLGGLSHGPRGILLPAVTVAALLFLLHRSRGGRGIAGPSAPSGGTGTSAAAASGGPGENPPAWDPLGAAPFAWDLPEPGPAPGAPPLPRSRVTPVTLALTLLAGGITALVLLTTGGLSDVPVLLGVVLAVLGGGLLVGAFTRSGRGLIPVALLAMAVTWGALSAPLDRIAAGPPRDLRIVPATAAALAPHYEISAGSVELDLRSMDLSVPPGPPAPPAPPGAAFAPIPPAPPVPPGTPPVATRIDAGVGSVEIWVPADADVRFTGSADVGSIEFAGQESSGPDARLRVDDLGVDGVASGRPILLDVNTGAGSVEVHRG